MEANALEMLPYWDRSPYYNIPVETTTLVAAAATQVLVGNPMRVAIIFSLAASGPIQVSTSPGVTTSSGMIVSTAIGYIQLTYDDFGPLVTLPWFAIGGAGAKLTVVDVTMQRWPGQGIMGRSLIEEADNGTFRALYERCANGNCRAKLHSDRWRKRQTFSPYDLPDQYNASLGRPAWPGGRQ